MKMRKAKTICIYYSENINLDIQIPKWRDNLTKYTILILNNKGKDIDFAEAYRSCYRLCTLKNSGADEVYGILVECLEKYLSKKPKLESKEHKIKMYMLRDIYFYYLRIKETNIVKIFGKIK